MINVESIILQMDKVFSSLNLKGNMLLTTEATESYRKEIDGACLRFIREDFSLKDKETSWSSILRGGGCYVFNISKMERVVMLHLATGMEQDEIARVLHLSEHTVKSHISAVIRKTGARNRANAIYLVLKSNQLGEEILNRKFLNCRRLNSTERKIVNLIALGYKNKEIASKLFVSFHTVKAYLAVIFKKLNAINRTHLTYIAYVKRLIPKNLEDIKS